MWPWVQRMSFRQWTKVAVLCVLSAHSAAADTAISCNDRLVRVWASESQLAQNVCDVVERAKPQLVRCHLLLGNALNVQIRDDASLAGLIAHYSKTYDRIVIRSPGNLTEMLPVDSAYRAIPVMHFFESIVFHELAQALFLETSGGRETSLAGHEYIAYAMQFESMPATARDLLLDTIPPSGPFELAWFTEARLHETPEVFAVNAWRHFSQESHGCDFVTKIVLGKVVFPSDLE